MRAGARGELAAGRFAAIQGARHFGEIETEHVMQEKARTLERRQTLEHQHQRHREIMREIASGFGISASSTTGSGSHCPT